MKKKERSIRYIAVVLLAGVVLCSGCTSKETDIPTLIEPTAANASYRFVEPGTIGETQILYGTVVPMEYCSFFDSYATLDKILVEVGDYVEKDDIVAYADVEVAKEQLEELTAQLENENQNFELNSRITQMRISRLEAWEETIEVIAFEDANEMNESERSENTEDTEGSKGQENTEDTEGSKEQENTEDTKEQKNTEDIESSKEQENAKKADKTTEESLKALEEQARKEQEARTTELATEKEKLRYDGLLHAYRVKKLQKEIADKQELITDGTLKAPYSGYVTYVKNLGESTEAAAYENIVIISDPEETYIEITDKTIDKYAYEDYEVKYLLLAGKRCEVTEFTYSSDTKVLAKAGSRYPNVRLQCVNEAQLTIGETYPIFFREKKLEDVPIIGMDSLNGEEGNYFVYVKGENGERQKRSVTIGETDRYYAQVLTGLEVGDAVYYESETSVPTEYEKYTVELSDYTVENLSRNYQLADEQVFWYDAECEGTITEIAVKEKAEVEKGDLLYIIESKDGKAALAAAKNNISRENTTYEETLKRMKESLPDDADEIEKEILRLKLEIEKNNHAYRLRQLEKVYNDMKKNNDGNGKIRVYAKQSGTVSKIELKEDAAVTKGMHVLSIGTLAKDKLLVQMKPQEYEKVYEDNIADFRENITITVEDSSYAGTYEGKCIGMTVHKTNNLSKNYVTVIKESTREETTQISYNTESGYAYPAFYVEMEDETFYDNVPMGKVTFSYVVMEDVIVVPTAMVQKESRAKDPTKNDYFVWRVVGDEIVKQYVLINEAFSDMNQTVILSGVKEQDVLARKN